MRSFQTLVTLVTLMLFATKEAAALPHPQRQAPSVASSSIGAVGNQIGVASGNISPSSVNVPAFPAYPGYPTYPGYSGYPGFPGYPVYPSGNTAASNIGTVGNQIGVASGNISPSSTNRARDLEARQYYPGYYYPSYYPPPNTAVSNIGTAGNQIGVASGNINPTSTNYRRDVEQDGILFPLFFPPLVFNKPAPAAGNTATSTLNTNGNQIGVAGGSGNQIQIGSANINPSSNNSARDVEDDRILFPLFFPPLFNSPAPAAGNTATSTLNTNGNQIGVVSGNGGFNQIGIESANINPTSTNSARELDVPPPNVAISTINTIGNQIGVASGNISPSSVNPPGFPGANTW